MTLKPSSMLTEKEWEAGQKPVKEHYKERQEALEKILEETRQALIPPTDKYPHPSTAQNKDITHGEKEKAQR